MTPKIVIFYHVFATNHWRQVVELQMQHIADSGLQAACVEIRVGLIVPSATMPGRQQKLARNARDFLLSHDKVAIHYQRLKPSGGPKPIQIWHNPKIAGIFELGEGETILKMAEHAQQSPGDSFCLFLHTKGVTNPMTSIRKGPCKLLERSGFSVRGKSDAELNAALVEYLTQDTVNNWKQHVAQLAAFKAYNCAFNFFWARADLLRQFDPIQYQKLSTFGKKYPLKQRKKTKGGRHWSASFVVGLCESLGYETDLPSVMTYLPAAK